MALLGIDLGTTACKAAAFDSDGRIIAKARREYTIIRPRYQWAEINPHELLDAVKSAVYEVNSSCEERISAISFSSQGEGVVPLDENFKPVGNIIVSYDRRAVRQTEKLRQILGEDFFYETCGQILSSAGTAPKIMWILENLPAVEKRPSHFACVGDYVLSCFSGRPIIDYSLAARTMLFDVHSYQWSEKALDAAGINCGMLSKIEKAGTAVDRISPHIAEELKLSTDAIIAAGGHDQPCAMLGAGATGKGEAVYSLGTTETLVCGTGRFVENLKNYGLPCYPHVIENEYITLPGNFTGGIILQWYKEQFGGLETQIALDTNRDVYDVILDSVEDTPSKLLILPHFTVTGSPYNDADSTGVILGLQLDTKRGEFIRGLLEGVTYEILLNIRLLSDLGINITLLRAIGGGVKSRKIAQLKSDILGIPLMVPKNTEATCKGAALLAAKAAGLIDDVKTGWIDENENAELYLPNKENNDYYCRQFEKYRMLYPAVKKIINTVG